MSVGTTSNHTVVDSSALPTGASTSAIQATQQTSLSSIDSKITAVNTGAVVVSSSALPTGAATLAKQPALGTAGSSSADVISVQGIASGTALPISAASLPLPSGAATLAKQPALGTAGSSSADVISVQGIASGTALPISAASLPLPSGAATLAKQPALGTAGTASADVITIQGIASMTKLLVTPDSVALPANQSVNVAQVNAVTPLMGTGNTGTGSLRVTIATDQAQLTNKLLVTPDANSAVNISQMNGVTVTMGNGASGTGVQRVTLASDGTGVVGLSTGANLVGYVGGKSTYAGKTTLATTAWTSLANAAGWQSVAVATSGARDVHIWLETQSTGTAYCDFYVAVKLSNGTGYTDAATGTEGTFTAANRLNSRYLGSVRINNAQAAAEFCLSDIFGGAMPANFALIGINNSGASINSTAGNSVFEYELVN